MEQKTKGNSWFSKVESKEKAIKIIDHISKVFMILGSLQILLGFMLEDFSFESKVAVCITGLVYICLGFLLKKFKNTIIAIILLLLSLTGVIATSMNLFGVFGNTQNRGLPIMGIAIAVASIQAIKATRKYNEKK